MNQCSNCTYMRERYIGEKKDLFYCELFEEIYMAKADEVGCEEYKPNLHDHCTAQNRS